MKYNKKFSSVPLSFCFRFGSIGSESSSWSCNSLTSFCKQESWGFFKQERPGKDSKIFKVVKFKTMTDERDEIGNFLPDEKILTKISKFIRSTSLDELLQ